MDNNYMSPPTPKPTAAINDAATDAKPEGQNIRKSGNKPDVYIQSVTRDGDKTYWQDVGATWDTSKEGYSKGKLKLPDGSEMEIVAQTREARELALAKIRSRKQEAAVELDNGPTQSL